MTTEDAGGGLNCMFDAYQEWQNCGPSSGMESFEVFREPIPSVGDRSNDFVGQLHQASRPSFSSKGSGSEGHSKDALTAPSTKNHSVVVDKQEPLTGYPDAFQIRATCKCKSCTIQACDPEQWYTRCEICLGPQWIKLVKSTCKQHVEKNRHHNARRKFLLNLMHQSSSAGEQRCAVDNQQATHRIDEQQCREKDSQLEVFELDCHGVEDNPLGPTELMQPAPPSLLLQQQEQEQEQEQDSAQQVTTHIPVQLFGQNEVQDQSQAVSESQRAGTRLHQLQDEHARNGREEGVTEQRAETDCQGQPTVAGESSAEAAAGVETVPCLDLSNLVHIAMHVEYEQSQHRFSEVVKEVHDIANRARRQVMRMLHTLLDAPGSDIAQSSVMIVSILNCPGPLPEDGAEVKGIQQFLCEAAECWKACPKIRKDEIRVCEAAVVGMSAEEKKELKEQRRPVLTFFSCDQRRMTTKALDILRGAFEEGWMDKEGGFDPVLKRPRAFLGENVHTTVCGYLPDDWLQSSSIRPDGTGAGAAEQYTGLRIVHFFLPRTCSEGAVEETMNTESWSSQHSSKMSEATATLEENAEARQKLGRSALAITDDDVRELLSAVSNRFVFSYVRGSVRAVCRQAIPWPAANLLQGAIRMCVRRERAAWGRTSKSNAEETGAVDGENELGSSTRDMKEQSSLAGSQVSVYIRSHIPANDLEALNRKTKLLDLTSQLLCKTFGFAPLRVCMSRMVCKRLSEQLLASDSVVLGFHSSYLFQRVASPACAVPSYGQFSGGIDLRINDTANDRRFTAWLESAARNPGLNVTALDLSSTKLNVASLRGLERFAFTARLTKLHLRDCHLDDVDSALDVIKLTELIAGCQCLQDLCLASNSSCLNAAGMSLVAGAVSQLTKLAMLDVSDNALADSSITELLDSTRALPLRTLDISHNLASFDPALCNNCQLPASIEHFALAWNRVHSASGLSVLLETTRTCPSITSVDLRGNAIADVPEGADMLVRLLQIHSQLQDVSRIPVKPDRHNCLSLAGRGLSSGEMQVLSSALSSREGSSLRSLDLSNNSLGHRGVKVLLPALRTLTNLESLDLGWCGLRVSGLAALMPAAVQQLSSLRILGLRANHLGVNGAGLLAQVVTRLHGLVLSENQIGSEGVWLLGLRAATALERLDLGCNEIGSSGAECLADALPFMTALRDLTLARNFLVLEAGAEVRRVAWRLANFRSLDLRDQITDPDDIDWRRVWGFCCGNADVIRVATLFARLRWAIPHIQHAKLDRATQSSASEHRVIRKSSFLRVIQRSPFRNALSAKSLASILALLAVEAVETHAMQDDDVGEDVGDFDETAVQLRVESRSKPQSDMSKEEEERLDADAHIADTEDKPSMEAAMEQVAKLCGRAISVGTRLQVLWDVEEGEDRVSSVWWGCSVSGLVGSDPEYTARWRLQYDEETVGEHTFSAEARTVVFCSRNRLLDIEYARNSLDEGLMQWHFEDALEELPALLKSGQAVLARYDESSPWIAGKVSRAHPDGTYDIAFETGEYRKQVAEGNVKPDDVEEGTKKRARSDRDEDAEADAGQPSTKKSLEHHGPTISPAGVPGDERRGGASSFDRGPDTVSAKAASGAEAGGVDRAAQHPGQDGGPKIDLVSDRVFESSLFQDFRDWGMTVGEFEPEDFTDMRAEFRQELDKLVQNKEAWHFESEAEQTAFFANVLREWKRRLDQLDLHPA